MSPTKPTRVLFVLTSHSRLGNTGRSTGYYLAEVSHPHAALTRAGWPVDFVSPQGGKAPVDGLDLTDPINRAFWGNPMTRNAVEHTLTPARVHADDYAAIFFAGGHGTMWDLPDNMEIAQLAARIYERGGVVGAVCHGPAGLVNVKLSDGAWLVAGKDVAAFTNEEERAVELTEVVPFFLADKLLERGARHSAAQKFTPKVVVSGRLVTGQNPQSALGVGEALVDLLGIASPENSPPAITAPSDAEPVVVTMRLQAKDAGKFKMHLRQVIPVTRRASGCRYSHSAENSKSPGEFLLVQAWDSAEQHQAYLSWRQQRGDLAQFIDHLKTPPQMETFALFDQ